MPTGSQQQVAPAFVEGIGWPLHLLRQELALRARRLLITGIQQLGVAIDDIRLDARMTGEWQLGRSLLPRLTPLLDPAEDEFMRGQQAFGALNAAWRKKVPLLLANGHTTHECLANLAAARPDRPGTSALAAGVFHLAAAASDHLIDQMDLAGPLAKLLSPDTVRAIFADRDALEAFVARRQELPLDELRLFCALVAAFAGLVQQLDPDPTARGWLIRWVADGYGAQLRSREAGAMGVRAQTCGTKALGTNVVMGTLAAHGLARPEQRLVMDLSERLGELLGRVDDLIDVVEDCLSGHVNYLLEAARAAGRVDPARGPTAVLNDLLTSGEIERCAERTLDLLEEIHARVQGAPGSSEVKAEFFQWLFAYIRGDLKLAEYLAELSG
jgi:hypothetical protein